MERLDLQHSQDEPAGGADHRPACLTACDLWSRAPSIGGATVGSDEEACDGGRTKALGAQALQLRTRPQLPVCRHAPAVSRRDPR
jgi:hypothetical protein